ncbi:MAG: hypothetical protein H7833_16995 [Magnetococcus sp. DMHC-1]
MPVIIIILLPLVFVVEFMRNYGYIFGYLIVAFGVFFGLFKLSTVIPERIKERRRKRDALDFLRHVEQHERRTDSERNLEFWWDYVEQIPDFKADEILIGTKSDLNFALDRDRKRVAVLFCKDKSHALFPFSHIQAVEVWQGGVFLISFKREAWLPDISKNIPFYTPKYLSHTRIVYNLRLAIQIFDPETPDNCTKLDIKLFIGPIDDGNPVYQLAKESVFHWVSVLGYAMQNQDVKPDKLVPTPANSAVPAPDPGKISASTHAHEESAIWGQSMEHFQQNFRLNSKSFFNYPHSQGLADDEPVVIRQTSLVSAGVPISPRPAGGVVLNMDRVGRIREDTEQVSNLLATIFAGEENSADMTDAGMAGLDVSHAQLLHLLRQAKTWKMADFQKLCKSLGVLPEGAMETINEWAYARFDEPLLEEADPLVLNLALLDEGMTS